MDASDSPISPTDNMFLDYISKNNLSDKHLFNKYLYLQLKKKEKKYKQIGGIKYKKYKLTKSYI